MIARASAAVALVLLQACSSADTTSLAGGEPLAGGAPGATAFVPASRAAEGRRRTASSGAAGATASGADAASRGSALDVRAASADAGAAGDSTPPPQDAGSAAGPLPCTLRLEWTRLVASHEGCQPLSSLPEAELAVWDGSRLTLLGGEWAIDDDRFARTRRCRHRDGQLWRFAERAELAESLPSLRCPGEPVEASYVYDECPLLSPGTVCAAAEPSACQITATLRLIPAAGDAAEAFAAPELEASCRPVGRDPRQPVAAGERCYDGECDAGHFCSRELGDATCAALGEGTCAPAPTSFDCGDTTEDLCLCTEPPLSLRALPPFDPARPDALAPNTCNAHALGLSVSACPAQ